MLIDLERIFYSEVHRICQKWAHYFRVYERHLSRFRGRPLRLLEIGVSQGGSLDIWRRYFGEDAMLIGVDIEPLCKRFERDRTHIRIGSQDDRTFLQQLAAELGQVDVLLDDGGHTMNQQKNTFEILYPIVHETGVYICEDVHTSYSQQYGGGLNETASFVEFAKKKIDELHAWYSNGLPVTDFSRTTASISFYDSMIVFEKQPYPGPAYVEVGRQY